MSFLTFSLFTKLNLMPPDKFPATPLHPQVVGEKYNAKVSPISFQSSIHVNRGNDLSLLKPHFIYTICALTL